MILRFTKKQKKTLAGLHGKRQWASAQSSSPSQGARFQSLPLRTVSSTDAEWSVRYNRDARYYRARCARGNMTAQWKNWASRDTGQLFPINLTSETKQCVLRRPDDDDEVSPCAWYPKTSNGNIGEDKKKKKIQQNNDSKKSWKKNKIKHNFG